MFLVPGALARGMLVAKPWRTATSSPDRGVPTVKSRAAVAWAAGRPLSIEEVDVAETKPGEVLVKIVATGECTTVPLQLTGRIPEGQFHPHFGTPGGGTCS